MRVNDGVKDVGNPIRILRQHEHTGLTASTIPASPGWASAIKEAKQFIAHLGSKKFTSNPFQLTLFCGFIVGGFLVWRGIGCR